MIIVLIMMKISFVILFSILASIVMMIGASTLVPVYAGSLDFISTFDGTTGGGTAFSNSRGITVDSNDRILVADIDLDTVQIFEDYSIPFTISSDGGGGCTDCTPPTLGVDKNNRRIVDDGLRYNDKTVDVEYYYTPFDLLTVEIGKENILELKIYENSGAQAIKHIGLSFGLGLDDIFNDGLSIIEWDAVFGEDPKITITDPENILGDVRVVADPNLVKCMDTSSSEKCMKFRIYHTFREGPDFRIFSTNIWDEDRNAWQNYFNHGLNVIGESLNSPDIHTVFDRQGYLYTITEVNTTNAIDENGDKWYLKDSLWKKEHYVKQEPPEGPTMAGYDRNNPYFTVYKNGEILLAEKTLTLILGGKDYSSIQSILPDYIPSAVSERIERSDDSELERKLKLEEIRAFELMYSDYQKLGLSSDKFPFAEPEIPEGFGGIFDTTKDTSSEQIIVILLMIAIIAVSVSAGFYFTRKK